MTWRRFGPEWNPVLIVLGVLAVLTALAAVKWWLGLIGIAAALFGLALVFWRGVP